MTNRVQERVIEIVAEQAICDVENVKLETTFDALGMDSLGMVEVVFAIEESFDITIPYNANEATNSDFDISTVAAVVTAVQKLIAEKAA